MAVALALAMGLAGGGCSYAEETELRMAPEDLPAVAATLRRVAAERRFHMTPLDTRKPGEKDDGNFRLVALLYPATGNDVERQVYLELSETQRTLSVTIHDETDLANPICVGRRHFLGPARPRRSSGLWLARDDPCRHGVMATVMC